MKLRSVIPSTAAIAVVAIAALWFAPAASAHVHVGVGIGFYGPGYSVGVSSGCRRCGYWHPAPVYYPPVVYAPAYYPAYPVYYSHQRPYRAYPYWRHHSRHYYRHHRQHGGYHHRGRWEHDD